MIQNVDLSDPVNDIADFGGWTILLLFVVIFAVVAISQTVKRLVLRRKRGT